MIPARFRREFQDKCMLVKGFDECLYLLTEEGFDAYVEKHIDNRPQEDKRAYDLQFFFFSNSKELDIDSQGRISLPKEFIEFAGIKKEMVNVGFRNRIEIWSKERYDKKSGSDELDPKKLLGNMMDYVPKP